MRGQADRITSLMSLETVDVGIIPLDADASVIPWVGFNLYDDLPEGQTPFVTVELPHAYLTASDPGDVAIYQQQLTAIRSTALHGQDAQQLLDGVGR
jgi:Domain of unknown function (DUF5753)